MDEDQIEGKIQEIVGDEDADHVQMFIHRNNLPGVAPGQKVQIVPLTVPPGLGFKLLVIVPEPAPPTP